MLEESQDREAWRVIVHEVSRVRHDLATKPPPPGLFSDLSGECDSRRAGAGVVSVDQCGLLWAGCSPCPLIYSC